MEINFEPIGIIRSCFKEKFGVPRQPGLATEARASLELFRPFAAPESVRGLETFTHLWAIFVFHKVSDRGWRPTVRPPRLGGNVKIGVFASRSPFRPNLIGMSAVEIERICASEGSVYIDVKGGDFLDGTPLLDIKPYVPWSDSPENASGGFAAERPGPRLEVVFSARAVSDCRRRERNGAVDLCALVAQAIGQDPRPRYHENDSRERIYGIRLFDFDVKWKVNGRTATVLSLEDLPRKPQGGP